MNKEEMNKLSEDMYQEEVQIRDAGQAEYARDEDNVFANFERVGATLDIPREKVLMIYLLKHIDGIVSYIDGHKSQRESVTGRITDAIVYLMLLWGMCEDKEYNENQLVSRIK